MRREGCSVALVTTVPEGEGGSMARYARLVKEALDAQPGGAIRARVHALAPGRRAGRWSLGSGLQTWALHVRLGFAGRRVLGALDADLVHVLDGSYGYLIGAVTPGRAVVTCHDAIPLLQSMGRLGPRPSLPARWLVRRAAAGWRRAARALAVSAHTRADICAHAGVDPGRADVVPLALDSVFLESARRIAGRGPVLRGGGPARLLHVGNDAFYKNRPAVLRVAARVAAERPVEVFMAGAPPDAELIALSQQSELRGRVRFAGMVGDAELAALYGSASLLLFPSLYEGFGWPVLEAMAMGCPVVCASAASLPEVAGDAALMADSRDEEGLAAHCLRLLGDPALASGLAQRGAARACLYTPARMGQGLRAAYEAALDRGV